jgi:lipoate-protein ligase A
LLDIDPELMYSVLKTPQGVSKSRMVRSVYAKCIGIKDFIKTLDEERLISSLKKGFENTLNIKLEEGSFSEHELNLAEQIIEERYSDDKWLRKYE